MDSTTGELMRSVVNTRIENAKDLRSIIMLYLGGRRTRVSFRIGKWEKEKEEGLEDWGR